MKNFISNRKNSDINVIQTEEEFMTEMNIRKQEEDKVLKNITLVIGIFLLIIILFIGLGIYDTLLMIYG